MTYVKASCAMPGVCWFGLMTRTVAGPAVPAGVTAMTWLLLIKVTCAESIPPNLTRQPVLKFCPETVTDVPPVMGPLEGVTEAMTGIGEDILVFLQDSWGGVRGVGRVIVVRRK